MGVEAILYPISPEEHTFTHDELVMLADARARNMLGVPWSRASEILDRGDLVGTVAEAELKMLRFMLGDE